jgi:hypothetical protein
MNEEEFLVRKGVVHGKTIELEEETGLPDGKRVVIGLCSEEELEHERAAEETLRAIYRMRHTGRSIIKP